MDISSLRYLIQQEINYFVGVWDSRCDSYTTIEDVLINIQEGEWKAEIDYYRKEKDKTEREELKKQFIGVTFSGKFKEARLDRNLERYTNILVVDIDKKDLKMKPKRARKTLQEAPFIFCVFESPSGGFKALAFSRMNRHHHKTFFAGLEEYFADRNLKMDASGKNPSRLCFISYDPDMYIENEGKEPFDLEKDAPMTFQQQKDSRFDEQRSVDYSKYKVSDNLRYIMDRAKKGAVSAVGGFYKGNRNNYIFMLACILNRAGIGREVSIDVIYSTYPSLGKKEIDSTVKSAYRHNSSQFGTKPIYQKKDAQSDLF